MDMISQKKLWIWYHFIEQNFQIHFVNVFFTHPLCIRASRALKYTHLTVLTFISVHPLMFFIMFLSSLHTSKVHHVKSSISQNGIDKSCCLYFIGQKIFLESPPWGFQPPEGLAADIIIEMDLLLNQKIGKRHFFQDF